MSESSTEKPWISKMIGMLVLGFGGQIQLSRRARCCLICWLLVLLIVGCPVLHRMLGIRDKHGDRLDSHIHVVFLGMRKQSGSNEGFTHIRNGLVVEMMFEDLLASFLVPFSLEKLQTFGIPGSSAPLALERRIGEDSPAKGLTANVLEQLQCDCRAE